MRSTPAETSRCISQDAGDAHLIVLGLDARVVVFAAHEEDEALVIMLDSPHIVERLCCVPVLALLPLVLQMKTHDARFPLFVRIYTGPLFGSLRLPQCLMQLHEGRRCLSFRPVMYTGTSSLMQGQPPPEELLLTGNSISLRLYCTLHKLPQASQASHAVSEAGGGMPLTKVRIPAIAMYLWYAQAYNI